MDALKFYGAIVTGVVAVIGVLMIICGAFAKQNGFVWIIVGAGLFVITVVSLVIMGAKGWFGNSGFGKEND